MAGAALLVLMALPAVAGATAGTWKAETIHVPGDGPWGGFGAYSVSCPSGTSTCVGVSNDAALVVFPSGATSVGLPLPPSPSVITISTVSVSCASPTWCVAVGSGDTAYLGGTSYGLVETLSGNTWTASVPDPTPGGRLDAVSCPSVGSCVAVGVTADGMAVDTLSAGTWQTESVGLTADGTPELTGISCLSASSCVAVGSVRDAGGATAELTETLSGTGWIEGSPDPAGVTGGTLSGISCPPATSLTCVAVGSDSEGPQIDILVDGTWRGVTGVGIAGYQLALDGVSCTSTRACQAVGSAGSAPNASSMLDVSLTGSVWRAAILWGPPGAPPVDQEPLEAVSCSGPARCTALGGATVTGQPFNDAVSTVVDRLAGGAWSASAAPGPPNATDNAISCPAVDSCVAVGTTTDPFDRIHPIIEAQSGTTWSATQFPAVTAVLSAVSCPAPGTCVAVGGGALATLAAGQWTFGDAPVPAGAQGVDLTAVSCPTAGWCEAAGSTIGQEGAAFETDTNGVWTTKEVAGSALPYAISCPAPGSCVAVGSYGGAPTISTLFAGTWSTVTGELTGTWLTGVACWSIGSCVASGFQSFDGAATFQPVVETIEGSTATPVALPNADADAALYGVSCRSANACVAVGDTYGVPGVDPLPATDPQGLVETLSAGTWSVTAGVVPAGATQSELNGVDCRPGVCAATGATLKVESNILFAVQPMVAVRAG